MAARTITRQGVCPEHGVVEAVKEVPAPSFPFIVWLAQRAMTPLRAFRCPQCDSKVRVKSGTDPGR